MSHNVNLGQASFQTEDSPLRLHFKAIGHFKLPINDSMQLSQGDNIQLSHLISAWVSEAPELELRLHVNITLCLEWSLSKFISSLGERICDSMVWPNLGFTIVFKSCETSADNNGSRTSCLTFGLCKGTCSIGQLTNRKVPLILRNPPAAHPPPVHPSVLLAAIDMCLQYSLSLEAESQGNLEAMVQTDNLLRDLDLGSGCSTFATETYSPDTGMEENMLSSVTDDLFNFLQVESVQPPLSQESDHSLHTTHLLPTAYHLLDKAFQRLMLARPSRNIQRNTIPDTTQSLAKMTDLAPAIFNPLYRQAIDQRAVSIPIISKAIASMIKGSRNPELKRRTRIFLQRFDTSLPSTADVSDHKRLTNAIQSSLWSIAQAQLREIKDIKKVNSFFRSDNESAILDSDTLLDTGLGLNMLLEPDICSNHDSELLDSNLEFNYNYYHDNIDYSIFDQNLTQNFDYTPDIIWPMDWLDSDGDEVASEPSIFEYISDSDPITTIDSIFSSCENTQFSQFEDELPRSSSDMLLCEEDRKSDELHLEDGFELLCEF